MKKNSLLIMALGILVSAGIGYKVPMTFGTVQEPLKVNEAALKDSLRRQFLEDLNLQVRDEIFSAVEDVVSGDATDAEVQLAKKKLASLGVSKKLQMTPAELDAAKKAGIDVDKLDAPSAQPSPTVTLDDGVTPASSGMTQQQVKDQWIQNKINANRDKISQEDLNAGASIYNSLDTNYLFGMAEGGLTPEEDAKVQEYLQNNLTSGEREIAQRLYYNYVGLLNEE